MTLLFFGPHMVIRTSFQLQQQLYACCVHQVTSHGAFVFEPSMYFWLMLHLRVPVPVSIAAAGD